MTATASMETGVLEAIDAIRPALQADGGRIEQHKIRRGARSNPLNPSSPTRVAMFRR